MVKENTQMMKLLKKLLKLKNVELENKLTPVNLEILELKQNNESNENYIFDLQRKCKTLEGDLKVEKKKIKKERQKK